MRIYMHDDTWQDVKLVERMGYVEGVGMHARLVRDAQGHEFVVVSYAGTWRPWSPADRLGAKRAPPRVSPRSRAGCEVEHSAGQSEALLTALSIASSGTSRVSA